MKENCPSEMPLDLKLVTKLAPESHFWQRGHKMEFEEPSMWKMLESEALSPPFPSPLPPSLYPVITENVSRASK